MKIINVAIAAFVCISFLACKKEQPVPPSQINLNELSVQDQMVIGEKLTDEISNHPTKFPILDRVAYAQAYTYVENVMNAMLNTVKCKNRNVFDWNVYIINNDDLSTAFNTPGGNIYIYTGLLKFLEAENELACVLSHEIAYIDLDLIGRRLIEEYGGKAMGDVLLENATTSELESMACSLVNIKFSYNTVFEADAYSCDMVCPFQYQAQGLKSVLRKIDNTNENLHWLETRPSYTNREEMIDLNSEDCGEGESTFEMRYLNFKSNLLP